MITSKRLGLYLLMAIVGLGGLELGRAHRNPRRVRPGLACRSQSRPATNPGERRRGSAEDRQALRRRCVLLLGLAL